MKVRLLNTLCLPLCQVPGHVGHTGHSSQDVPSLKLFHLVQQILTPPRLILNLSVHLGTSAEAFFKKRFE